MKISVIIPVYQVEDYIEACVASVLGQTYRDIELILVDDGGGDASIARAEPLLVASNREWKLIRHESNKGLAAARNSGVQAASGDFLFFLDADDVLPPHALSHLVSLQATQDADVVVGSMQLLVPEDSGVAHLPAGVVRVERSYETEAPFEAFLKGDFYVSACCKLIRRSFYQEKGLCFEEGMIYEDEAWTMRLALECRHCSLSSEPVYHYRIREGSTVHAQGVSVFSVRSLFRSVQRLDALIEEYGLQGQESVRQWYWEKAMACLLRIHHCPGLRLVEKLSLYKGLLAESRCPRPVEPTANRVLHLTWLLSGIFPVQVAFCMATRAQSWLRGDWN